MTTIEKPTYMQAVRCAPWCVDGDGHPREHFRNDQCCNGPMQMLLFSLEDHAQAIPVSEIDAGAPHCNVYARQNPHSLPMVVLHVFRDHHRHEKLSVDAEFKLTPAEAIELAENLITVVEAIAGACDRGPQ